MRPRRESWILISGMIAGAGCAAMGIGTSYENWSIVGIGLTLFSASYLIDPCNPHSYTAKRFPKE